MANKFRASHLIATLTSTYEDVSRELGTPPTMDFRDNARLQHRDRYPDSSTAPPTVRGTI